MKNYNSSSITGLVGESITATTLQELCDMKIFHKIILPRGRKYTEIDLVGVNKYGIFLFENKNYSGYILGDYSSELWDVQYSENDVFTLYSPIEQNKYHFRAFIDFLRDNGLYNIPLYHYIIFNNRVKGLFLDDKCKDVVFVLNDFVKFYNNQKFEKTIDDLNYKIIVNILRDLSNYSSNINLVNDVINTLTKEQLQITYFKED